MKPSGVSASPLFEHAEAAKAFGKTLSEFQLLPGERQSEMVAIVRAEAMIGAVLASEAEMKAQAARKK